MSCWTKYSIRLLALALSAAPFYRDIADDLIAGRTDMAHMLPLAGDAVLFLVGLFVAGFIGDPPMNLLPVHRVQLDGHEVLEIADGPWKGALAVIAVSEEDVDGVGLSILSGAHMTLVPRVVEALRQAGVGLGDGPDRDQFYDNLTAYAANLKPRNFRVAENRTPPDWVKRVGIDTIEAIAKNRLDKPHSLVQQAGFRCFLGRPLGHQGGQPCGDLLVQGQQPQQFIFLGRQFIGLFILILKEPQL